MKPMGTLHCKSVALPLAVREGTPSLAYQILQTCAYMRGSSDTSKVEQLLDFFFG